MAGLGTAVPVTQPTSYPLPHYHHGGFGSDAEDGCVTIIDKMWVGESKCTQSQLAGLDGYRWTSDVTVYHEWGRYGPNSKDPGFPLYIAGKYDLTITIGALSSTLPLGAFFSDDHKMVDSDFIDSIVPYLDLALKRDSCKDFLKKYVGGADLLSALSKVREQNGIYERPLRPKEPYAAYAMGKISAKKAGIEFNHNPNPYPIKFLVSGYIATKSMVHTLIHELIHLVDEGGHDPEMARRVIEGGDSLATLPNVKDFDKYGNAKDGSGTNYTYLTSKIWNDVLHHACDPSEQEFKKWWASGGQQ
jgi:hypothetical protein